MAATAGRGTVPSRCDDPVTGARPCNAGRYPNLGTLTAMAVDTASTLTEGKPRLTDVVALDGGEGDLLRTAVAVERRATVR